MVKGLCDPLVLQIGQNLHANMKLFTEPVTNSKMNTCKLHTCNTVQFNYNFILTWIYMCGTTTKLHGILSLANVDHVSS